MLNLELFRQLQKHESPHLRMSLGTGDPALKPERPKRSVCNSPILCKYSQSVILRAIDEYRRS